MEIQFRNRYFPASYYYLLWISEGCSILRVIVISFLFLSFFFVCIWKVHHQFIRRTTPLLNESLTMKMVLMAITFNPVNQGNNMILWIPKECFIEGYEYVVTLSSFSNVYLFELEEYTTILLGLLDYNFPKQPRLFWMNYSLWKWYLPDNYMQPG